MRTALMTLWVCGIVSMPSVSVGDERDELNHEFQTVISPFIKTYCTGCHGKEKPKAKFDLSPYVSADSVAGDLGHWRIVLKRLAAKEMPSKKAKKFPDDKLRQRVIDWIQRLRRHEAKKNAGDPGPVLARRLSNAEFDYSIHDLTGINIRPTREFPVDPANKAGFDNSGESLTMSPALLTKYLAAARRVADHLVLLPNGLDFAPHPVVIYSDRDKLCVHRIVDFYKKHPVDYADYFLAAWRYRHRAKFDMPEASLQDIAKADGISAKYLKILWTILSDSKSNVGPIESLRKKWNSLPPPVNATDRNSDNVRAACERLRQWVIVERKKLNIPFEDFRVKELNRSSQPIVLWKNRLMAANRQIGKLPKSDGTEKTAQLRIAITSFSRVFPDTFLVSERGRLFINAKQRNKGRLLSAGFHLMIGYFRDDKPLYDLILDPAQQKNLDDLWRELDFVTLAPMRQYGDYIYFERAENPGFLKAREFDFARQDADVTSESKMQRLATLYLGKAREAGIDQRVLRIIDTYFQDMSTKIRRLEKALADAEPKHLEALLGLTERAWQRPVTQTDRDELLGFYRSLKEKEGLSHEDALRDTLVSVLMSPRFSYRITVAEPGPGAKKLSNHALASRLSYFLWSSIPDAELLAQAAAGDLHNREVLLKQTRRMLRDPRIRRLATEFAGNWLDFRRFETHKGVNRDRFANFTDELRQAMYQEPIRFFTDLAQNNGSVLQFINAEHTFVNSVLAKHYGMPFSHKDPMRWVRFDNARQFGRGGLLPMSVFLTKNSPGLRTSPVKRGYWVVRRLLGEHIPPPPPQVPELPEDESKLDDLSLRQVLAKHRQIKSCAACHSRFDSMGLVFEGYGPIGRRREKDLGGRPVDTSAVFPDGGKGDGLKGLTRYLRESRQGEFIDNLCRKLLSYGLGRSLQLSDESTIEMMKNRLAATEYRFGSMVATIVTSPQFLRKRGRDHGTSGKP